MFQTSLQLLEETNGNKLGLTPFILPGHGRAHHAGRAGTQNDDIEIHNRPYANRQASYRGGATARPDYRPNNSNIPETMPLSARGLAALLTC